jgi:hypothetical protein
MLSEHHPIILAQPDIDLEENMANCVNTSIG